LVTVGQAAVRANRSPQWVRDEIRAGRLAALQQGAGTQIRWLIEEDDLDRRLAELQPVPYVGTRRPPTGFISTSIRSESVDTDLSLDTVLAAGLQGDVDKLTDANERLITEVVRLRQQRDHLREMLEIALKGFRDAP
jgi:hypothetical protein